MVVIWMPEALETLENIRLYLHKNDAPRAAAKLVQKLRKQSGHLANNPELGIKEPLLAEEPEGYRSLIVSKRYKLIYFIENETVYIDAIYDCRQHPYKLRHILKKK